MSDVTPPQGAKGAVHAQLIAVAEDWAAAIVSNDAARMASCMANEWVIVSASGVCSKEQFLSVVASGELCHSAMQLVGGARIRAYGEVAVVTGRVDCCPRQVWQRVHGSWHALVWSAWRRAHQATARYIHYQQQR